VPTLIAIAAGLAVPFALLFFVVGAAIPYFVVRVKADRRARAFDDQLPDALNTLAGTLQVGHSFTQGVQALVESADAPISEEFGRVLTELRLGARLDTALLDMGARIGSRDLDFVIRAVIVQRTVGGGLAALFELIADTVDKRHKFKLRVKALTAMGRMSATVLICLPFGVALLVSAVNPGYMAPLFRTTVGQVLLAVGLTMIVIGSLILRRMVAIKV
jgi:tight adherence protein B